MTPPYVQPTYDDIRRFVLESNKLDGISCTNGPLVSNHERAALRAKHQWRHCGLISPQELHEILVFETPNQHPGGVFRTIPVRGKPLPEFIPELMKNWSRIATFSCQETKDSEKSSWVLHDLLLCIEPFQSANGRVARLVLNAFRSKKELPWVTITAENSGAYRDKAREFEERVYRQLYPSAYQKIFLDEG